MRHKPSQFQRSELYHKERHYGCFPCKRKFSSFTVIDYDWLRVITGEIHEYFGQILGYIIDNAKETNFASSDVTIDEAQSMVNEFGKIAHSVLEVADDQLEPVNLIAKLHYQLGLTKFSFIAENRKNKSAKSEERADATVQQVVAIVKKLSATWQIIANDELASEVRKGIEEFLSDTSKLMEFIRSRASITDENGCRYQNAKLELLRLIDEKNNKLRA